MKQLKGFGYVKLHKGFNLFSPVKNYWPVQFLLLSLLIIFFVVLQPIKGAMKSYFTHFSCVVIVFYNTALCRSVFSTVSFSKLLFHFSVPSFNPDIKICVIMLCNFVPILYKNSPFINNKLFIKILQIYVKTCFQRCFEFFKK